MPKPLRAGRKRSQLAPRLSPLTGPWGLAFRDFLVGSLPAATGRKMHFTGTTVLKVQNGKILQEIGLDDGVAALTQLGLLKAA